MRPCMASRRTNVALSRNLVVEYLSARSGSGTSSGSPRCGGQVARVERPRRVGLAQLPEGEPQEGSRVGEGEQARPEEVLEVARGATGLKAACTPGGAPAFYRRFNPGLESGWSVAGGRW